MCMRAIYIRARSKESLFSMSTSLAAVSFVSVVVQKNLTTKDTKDTAQEVDVNVVVLVDGFVSRPVVGTEFAMNNSGQLS